MLANNSDQLGKKIKDLEAIYQVLKSCEVGLQVANEISPESSPEALSLKKELDLHFGELKKDVLILRSRALKKVETFKDVGEVYDNSSGHSSDEDSDHSDVVEKWSLKS